MMHAHVRHQGRGWQPRSVAGDWRKGRGLKRLRPQRSEVIEGMEVERRNKKISGGTEEEEAPVKGLWMRFLDVGAN